MRGLSTSLWCAAAVGLLAIAWFLLPRDPITQAIYSKIQRGMTLDEVEKIIGIRGLDHDEAAERAAREGRLKWIRIGERLNDGIDWDKPNRNRLKCWQERFSFLVVELDDDGRVSGKSFEERSRINFFYDIRAWLGW